MSLISGVFGPDSSYLLRRVQERKTVVLAPLLLVRGFGLIRLLC